MHISDGIINANVCTVANVACLGLVYITGRNVIPADIPKMGMTGAALFVVSLFHFPLAGVSMHPGLYGLAGIMLGRHAFPAVFTALLFQSLLFQHGGLLALGVNSVNMGAGAGTAWIIWRARFLPEKPRAALAGFFGVLVPVFLMSVEFIFSGYGRGIFYLLSIYVPLAAAEGIITFSAVRFFRMVKPELIRQ